MIGFLLLVLLVTNIISVVKGATAFETGLEKRNAECATSGVYRGNQAVTQSGLKCQAWASQTPHKHTRTPGNYPAAGLVENFCRNPDGEATGNWCYTDSAKRWETCGIPDCPAQGLSGQGALYRDDLRCGPKFKLPSGDPAQCDPNPDKGFACCSPGGWCGKTDAHCNCHECVDYSDSETTSAAAHTSSFPHSEIQHSVTPTTTSVPPVWTTLFEMKK